MNYPDFFHISECGTSFAMHLAANTQIHIYRTAPYREKNKSNWYPEADKDKGQITLSNAF